MFLTFFGDSAEFVSRQILRIFCLPLGAKPPPLGGPFKIMRVNRHLVLVF
jgi:hypothetical protein